MANAPLDPDRECGSCGASSWRRFYATEKSDTTDVERFVCTACDAEGRRFTHDGGTTIYSGAMR